jgi:hypothetical protein
MSPRILDIDPPLALSPDFPPTRAQTQIAPERDAAGRRQTSLTARAQAALRGNAAATAALWLATAWVDRWILLAVPLIAGGFFVYRAWRRDDQPDENDPDFF